MPGHTYSKYPIIEKAYQQSKELLLKQISYYEPDIVIGGYTLYNFFSDLGFAKIEMQQHGSLNYIIKGNKLFIDAYHPAQRNSVTQEQYCDDIISAAKVFCDTKLT